MASSNTDDIDVITDCILRRLYVKIQYNGGSDRLVQPYIFGAFKSGKVMLSAYQIGGDSVSKEYDGWKLFNLEKITLLEPIDATFEIRNEYNENDERFVFVFAGVRRDE